MGNKIAYRSPTVAAIQSSHSHTREKVSKSLSSEGITIAFCIPIRYNLRILKVLVKAHIYSWLDTSVYDK